MRRILAAIGLGAAVMAAWPLVLETSKARTRGDATFVIPANDGYGIAECLGSGGDCGSAVADSWCAANGFSRAVYFGPSLRQGLAGSTETPVAADATLTITCED